MATDSSDAPVAPSAGARLTIGRVLDTLKDEFPDVSPSKVRFLEAEGLVVPDRTPSGYRSYSAADVERLRYVLRAQRDRYWPLKVIREALEAIDRGLPDPGPSGSSLPAAPAPVHDPDVPGAEELVAKVPMRLTAREVREGAGLDKDTFADLLRHGLLRAGPTGHYDEHDLAVAGAVRALADHGLEPRHLRGFRAAADREVGLVRQVVASTREQARPERAAEVASACIRLHAALVKGGLAR